METLHLALTVLMFLMAAGNFIRAIKLDESAAHIAAGVFALAGCVLLR